MTEPPPALAVEEIVRLCTPSLTRPAPTRVRVSVEVLAAIKRYGAELPVLDGRLGDYASVPVVLDGDLLPGGWEIDE